MNTIKSKRNVANDLIKKGKSMIKSHRNLDKRSLFLHTKIAEKIQKNPELLHIAIENITSWEKNQDIHVQPYLDQWKNILNTGLDETIKVMLSFSEEAIALRQSSPFPGILTKKERLYLLKIWNEKNET